MQIKARFFSPLIHYPSFSFDGLKKISNFGVCYLFLKNTILQHGRF